MNADGSHQIRLTHNYQSQWCTPAWSPDGQRLAFVVRPSDGSPEIYLVDADGTAPIRLARDAWYPLKNAWRAAWSPDSRQIVYDAGVPWGLNVIDQDGTNQVHLGSGQHPAWTP